MPDIAAEQDFLNPPSDPPQRKISVLGAEAVDRGQWTGMNEYNF